MTQHTQPSRFEPDTSGLLVAALDCQSRETYLGRPDLLHRLIGRERQDDGSARLVVLPYAGTPRTLGNDEPHRVLNQRQARTFDLADWQRATRLEEQDRRDALEVRHRRQSLKAQLTSELVILTGPSSLRIDGRDVPTNSETHRVAQELIADGLAHTVSDGVLVTAQPAPVELSSWSYLNTSGPATFTAAERRGLRMLVHGCPTRRGETGRAGSFPVVGLVTAPDGRSWFAYIATTALSRSLELLGEGVPGTWANPEPGIDIAEWVELQDRAAEHLAQAQALESARAGVRDRLFSEYAITPRTEAERAACEEIAASGDCYETEGSYVLAVRA